MLSVLAMQALNYLNCLTMAKFKDQTLMPKQYCDGGLNIDWAQRVSLCDKRVHDGKKKVTFCLLCHELRS